VLERALNEYEIDSVFHLGAQPIVGAANRNPLSTFEANIQGTWHLLEAVRRSTMVTRVVVASSDKAYGTQDVLPYTEEMSLQGRHPYDVSKSCTDLIAQTYAETYKLPVSITRCGNFYGGGDLNFNRIIPGTIRSVLFNERPIIRSDGTYIRDYIYVLDVADAYLLLAEKMDDATLHGEAFNFSNELQLTVLDLTQKILQAMGRDDLAPSILNQATGEIKHQYLSAAKARRVLNWAPNYTIERSLQDTISWYREFFESRGLIPKT
jgi:CDP-glucose 4,6-dehydratase